MTANTQNPRTNVLILGKTGVGKSSLLNYLFGGKVARVGDGRPVTPEGIHKHEPFSYNGISFVIYDSWGMEPEKANKWKKLIEEEVQKNNAQEVHDWFHTVIYCVDAERARMENFEVQDVLYPLIEGGNCILFALTKAGLNETNTKMTIKVLKEDFPDCDMVEVESVSAKLMCKPPTVQKGREVLLDKICRNLWDNILNKSIDKYKRDTRDVLYKRLTSETLRYFAEKAGPLGIFTHYGEEFKNNIMEHAELKVRSILTATSNQLKENISVGQSIAIDVCKALGENNMPFANVDVNRLVIDNFSEWDNGGIDYFATIAACIIFPPGFFVRKDRMSDIIKKGCIKFVDELEKILDEHSEKLREELGAKKRQPRKNTSMATAIHERNMFEILRGLEKR